MSSDEDDVRLDLADLDLPTVVSLVGAAVDRAVLTALTDRGLPGLRAGHGHVVQRLVPGPSTVTEIAEAVGLTQQAVSKTVQELVGLGYVEQRTDPHDRRRRPLALTRRGRLAVTTARDARRALHDEVAAAVTPRDVAAARRALSALARALGLDGQVARRSVPATPDRS